MKRLSGALEPGLQQDMGSSVTTKQLDYDRSIVPQETGYNCGPAAAQIVLNAAGIKVPESQLAREMGTHTGGTDTIDLVLGALKKHAPQAKFASQWMPNDPPTKEQKELLWKNTVKSINAGWAMVCNWIAPPRNHPRPVPPSDPKLGPNYGGSTVWHYVCCAGYSDEGQRKVWIADSGFKPFGYWISFDQHATLIPNKGYTYSTLVTAEPVEPKPEPPAQQPVDTILHEVTQRIPGRLLDGQLAEVITDPTRRDTVLGHAVNAASLSRINYEILLRIAEKLGVDLTGIR